MKGLEISLFGGFKASRDGSLLTGFESGKVQALLAYLVVEADQPHQRGALATLFWPDAPESTARTNLRHILLQLRQVLGDRDIPDNGEDALGGAARVPNREVAAQRTPPFLLTTRNTIQFNTQSIYRVDVVSFAHLLDTRTLKADAPIEQAQLEQFEAAAALYQGEFLADFHVHDAELFDEWVALQRERYHRMAYDLFAALTAHYEAVGDLTRAQHFATRQTDLEPWREEAHRTLMLILARSNQRSAALAQYEQCRLLLAQELGVEPSPETKTLYDQIRLGWLPVAQQPPLPQPDPVIQPPPAQTLQPDMQRSTTLQDWGEAPSISRFYGRVADQATLRGWLLEDRAKLVVVLGMGGMGKTTLVAHTSKQIAGEFDFVFWRSLLNAPTLTSILGELLRFLSRQQLSSLPDSLHEQFNMLFEYLRQHRCLIVLDNLESILEADARLHYHPGYENYGYLIERVGQSTHQSSLILTSRELPLGMSRLEGNAQVNILQLGGLEEEAGHELLQTRGIASSAQVGASLVRRYSGNPLALKLVARTIHDFFDGDVAAFLSDELPIFDDIRAVLDQHFARLTELERELLIWMAVEREPVTLPHLAQNLVRAPSRNDLLSALGALQRHSLLEKHENGFVLQNVVMEYLTDTLVGQVCQEIEQGQIDYLHRFALLKAQSMEYVRQSQVQLIVAPVARRLLANVGPQLLQERLRTLIATLRANPPYATGYGAGNLLNLLLHLGVEMRGFDFSGLVIRQVDLRGANLLDVNFSSAVFSNVSFTGTFNVVRAVACSPDGQRLAAGTSDGEIRLWRFSDGQMVANNQGHARPVNAVVFRPAGDLFASASNDFTVRLWDAATGQPRQTLVGHTGWVQSIAFSSDGQLLASGGSDQSTCVWDVATGTLRQRIADPAGNVRAVAIHPHAPVLASTGDQVIRLWDLESGQFRMSLEGHSAPIMALAYSPNGKLLASGSIDQSVRLWETESGRCVAILSGHESEVRCLTFSPDGELLASGSADYTVRLWDIRVAQANDPLASSIRYTLHGHVKGVNSVTFTPQGETLISGGDDHTIHFWNPRNGSARDVWFGHTGWVRVALFNPRLPLLASCGDDGFVRLWDIQTGELYHLLTGHRHWIWSMAFSPDGRLLATGGADHLLCIWDVQSGELRHLLRDHDNTVRALAFHPDGSLLASGSADTLVHLWEPVSGRLVHTLRGHTGWIQTLAFRGDGKVLATAGNDQTILLWRIDQLRDGNVVGGDAADNVLPLKLVGQPGTIFAVAFSPDGSLLASAGDALAVYLWDGETGELRHVLEGHEHGVNSLAFSPDGRVLATGASDHTVRLWDVASGSVRVTLTGHRAWVRSVAFSLDGSIVASCSADHTIRLWDVESGQLLHMLEGHEHWVWSLDFRPAAVGGLRSPLLASSSVDKTVRLWDVQSGKCRMVLRPLGPYAGMNITGATGISDTQKATLKQLGAFES